MPGDTMIPTEDAVLATLIGPPFNLSFDAARAAIADGTASNIVAKHEQDMRDRRADHTNELTRLREAQRKRVKEQSDKVQAAWNREQLQRIEDAKPKPGDHIGDPSAVDQLVSEGGRDLPADEDETKCVSPPFRTPVLTAQSSEPEPERFFVCKRCNGGFSGRAGAPAVSCPCGSARFGDDGIAPFSEMRIPLCTGDAFEVTELVACGKLSATHPDLSVPSFVLYALHNRPNRNVPQEWKRPHFAEEFAADVRASSAGYAVAKGAAPSLDYMVRAAMNGADVHVTTHYHTRTSGIETNAAGEKFAKKELTGDMRVCGSVIARTRENEADGSLLFIPVVTCARCGQDHAKPLAFWKLKQPVYANVANVANVAHPDAVRKIASHFAHCPTSGEPILLISSEPETDLALQFDKPADVKTDIEEYRDMNEQGGLMPVDGPIPNRIAPVDSAGGSGAYDSGKNAARAGKRIDDNPHPLDSSACDEWRRGFVDGKANNG